MYDGCLEFLSISEGGGGARLLFLLRKYRIRRATMVEMTTSPPTAPPTAAPITTPLLWLALLIGEGYGENVLPAYVGTRLLVGPVGVAANALTST